MLIVRTFIDSVFHRNRCTIYTLERTCLFAFKWRKLAKVVFGTGKLNGNIMFGRNYVDNLDENWKP